MKQKKGISRYLYTLLFLFLAAAVVTITGSCGGGAVETVEDQEAVVAVVV